MQPFNVAMLLFPTLLPVCHLIVKALIMNATLQSGNAPFFLLSSLSDGHRGRIYTEEKAKVVAAVWGEESLAC